ncbi:MAG TPA: alkaline phosphatase, partial [Vicinamibacteria bacterium]|nr:alkaline phosphatase [Vicinamibacteria bacterium]
TSSSSLTPARREAFQRENPHIHFSDAEHRGYVLVELTQSGGKADLRGLDDVTRKDSGISTLASFAIEDGRPGFQRS